MQHKPHPTTTLALVTISGRLYMPGTYTEVGVGVLTFFSPTCTQVYAVGPSLDYIETSWRPGLIRACALL